MTKRYYLFLCLVFVFVLAACSDASETEVQPEAEPSPELTTVADTEPAPELDEGVLDPEQQAAFDQMISAAGFEPELLMDMGLPRFVSPYIEAASDDPETAAREFFAAYSGLYGLASLDQALQLSQIQEVNAGTLVRFQQYLEDLPVYGGQAVVSLTRDGLVPFVNSALHPRTMSC